MKTKSVLFFAMIITMFVSGCFVVPDRVASKISTTLFPPPPPGYVPYDRIDVFNTTEGTFMTLHDDGGEKLEHVQYGKSNWMPQNTYFGSDGYDHVSSNVVTANFYDVTTGVYVGSMTYYTGCRHYQKVSSPRDRRCLEP
jgi:hypothetical protein